MISILTASELQRWMSEQRRFTLIDVLPEEVFNAQHQPGARRATVYEVSFLDQIQALGVGRVKPLVLYGAEEGSLDSAVAAGKLERAGFQQVYDFRGGRAEWAQAGGAFEGDGALPEAPQLPEDKRYAVNPDKSSLEWIGRNLSTTHRGTIRVERGHFTVAGGELIDGHVVLDMRSIENKSVEDPKERRMLEEHLKSDDFFDVEPYPTAELKVRSASPLAGATPGAPNFEFTASSGNTVTAPNPAAEPAARFAHLLFVRRLCTEWLVLGPWSLELTKAKLVNPDVGYFDALSNWGVTRQTPRRLRRSWEADSRIGGFRRHDGPIMAENHRGGIAHLRRFSLRCMA